MTKDPAFLFYTSDFLTGTMFMNNEQVGIYIRLLCAQHQHGGLIDKVSFNSMVGNNDVVRVKFIEEEDGFFNERLMNEMTKRSRKSSNLSANAKKGWEKRCKSNASALHLDMPTEDVNENEDVNVIDNKKKLFRKPTLQQVIDYCKEIQSTVDPETFFHNYESTGWIKANGQKVKNWKSTLKTWEKRNLAKDELKPKKQDPDKRYRETQEYLRNLEAGKI